MRSADKTIELQTKREYDFIDLTDEVKAFVKEGGIKEGFVNVQTMHTTGAVILNENEPLLLEDMKRHLEALSPKMQKYSHDNFEIRTVNMCDDECANGHSHCKAMLLPANITLNLIGGELQLGQWQRILFLELDKSRPRKVQIHIIGE